MTNARLDFKITLVIFLAVAMILTVIILGFNNFSNLRKQAVYDQYAAETQNWIDQNQLGLQKLFIEVFPTHDCPPLQGTAPLLVACPGQEAIAIAISQNLKNWSSTEFIKKEGIKIWVMRLSGDTREFNLFSQEKKNKIYQLLAGEVSEIPWDDYTSDFQGKEVIIPIKDATGKILGAVVRGVIETSGL